MKGRNEQDTFTQSKLIDKFSEETKKSNRLDERVVDAQPFPGVNSSIIH